MDIRRIDLNLLVVFNELLQTRSVSRAAERLGMSQPATSYALNKLRGMLGDPLFVRTSRGIVPTPYAEGLMPPLQDVLDRIRTAFIERPRFDPATATRTFTLGLSDIAELFFLPRIVAFVSQVAPAVEIRSCDANSADLEQALGAGRLDLALGNYRDPPSALVFRQRLIGHSYVVVIRGDHPGIGTTMTRKQYTEGLHAVVDAEGGPEADLEGDLGRQGISRRVVLRLRHYLAIPAILQQSQLIFTVPYAIGADLVARGDVRMLPAPFATTRAHIRQFWHSRFHHDPASQWIRSIVAERFLEERRRSKAAPGTAR